MCEWVNMRIALDKGAIEMPTILYAIASMSLSNVYVVSEIVSISHSCRDCVQGSRFEIVTARN